MSLSGDNLKILKRNLRIGHVVTHPPIDNQEGIHIRSKVVEFNNDKVIVDIAGVNEDIEWSCISWARNS